VINLIIFISRNGEKVPKNQKIFVFLFFLIYFFKKEIRRKKKKKKIGEKKKKKKPVWKYYILEAAKVSTTLSFTLVR